MCGCKRHYQDVGWCTCVCDEHAGIREGQRRQPAVRFLCGMLDGIAALDPSNPANNFELPNHGPGWREWAYVSRNGLILEAMGLATRLGFKAGVQLDATDPERPAVIYIELPTGQVSWHLPQHFVPFDGHTTEEKYARIQRFIEVSRSA